MTEQTEALDSHNAARRWHNRAVLGIILMIAGLALYALSDAFLKHLMSTYSVQQTLFLRALSRLIPLAFAASLQGGLPQVLRTEHPWQHAFRLLVNLIYTSAFIYAVSLSSLTDVYTLGYTAPLFMIILSALFLHERVSSDRWIAVAIGMTGVVVAMRPQTNLFAWGSAILLLGAFLSAVNKTLMRQLAKTEHSLAITIYPNIVMILATIPFVLFTWQTMPLSHWLVFGFVGIITALAQYSIAQALRFAPVSVLAPIDYSTLFWVVSWDVLWWERTPDISTIMGAIIIIGSNLYILQRTRKEEAVAESNL
jgi:drug/metabolite transporter (DMT)-like permease